MSTTLDIREVVAKFGRRQEHLMLILRELEIRSGCNCLDPATLREVAEEMNLPPAPSPGLWIFTPCSGPLRGPAT